MACAADVHSYLGETIIAPCIEVLVTNIKRIERAVLTEEYSWFYDCRQFIKMSKPKIVNDVGKMAPRNAVPSGYHHSLLAD